MSESIGVNTDTIVVRHPACFVRKEDEEGGFLFNPDTGKVYLMNLTAVGIWDLLDGKRLVADVVAELQAKFPDAAAEIEQQVLQHLQAMSAIGVVGTVGA